MPTVLRRYGFRFHFYSNESREPAHIHVTGHGGELKVWLANLRVEWSFGLTASEQSRLMKVIRGNREMLLEKWYEFTRKKT